MVINYKSWSESYSKFRDSNIDFARTLIKEANLNKDSKVLEVGSGTGNYCRLINDLSGAEIVGVDSSKEMIKEARKISKKLLFKFGNALNLPFQANSFDFIFYFDTIHHIKNISKSLDEAFRVLKQRGKICIITNSSRQIKERISAKYFPSVTKIDLKRYYTIAYLRRKLLSKKFKRTKMLHIISKRKRLVNRDYYNLIKNKAFSVFHSVSKKEFNNGLLRLRYDIDKGLRSPIERTFIFADK